MYKPKVGETVWCICSYDDDYDEVFTGKITEIVVEDERYPSYQVTNINGEERVIFPYYIYKTEKDLLHFRLEELYEKRTILYNKIERIKEEINKLCE